MSISEVHSDYQVKEEETEEEILDGAKAMVPNQDDEEDLSSSPNSVFNSPVQVKLNSWLEAKSLMLDIDNKSKFYNLM